MTVQPDGAPEAWDLDWEPIARSGQPERFPPSSEAAYAEFPLRALAFAVDALLVWLIFQLLGQGRSLVVLLYTRDRPEAQDAALALSGAAELLFVGAVTLSAVYFWRVFRATPGQMFFGLFVLRAGTGQRLTRGRAFLRWLALYAPLAVLLSYTIFIDLLLRTDLMPGGDPLLVAGLAFGLPLLWYATLAGSTLAEGRRGRGLHDRLAGSVVVRRAGPPA